MYRFLPDEIRAFFLDSGLDDIEAIAATYGLSQEAVDSLDEIQQEVLFGYEPVDKVRNLIQQRLKFDAKLSTRVALDLIEKRFLPIDSFLGATAFRTFSSLGGNATVINIKRIDATGGTVADVRRRMVDFEAEERANRTGKDLDAKKAAEQAPPAPEPVKPKSASPVAPPPDKKPEAPKKAPKPAPKKPAPSKKVPPKPPAKSAPVAPPKKSPVPAPLPTPPKAPAKSAPAAPVKKASPSPNVVSVPAKPVSKSAAPKKPVPAPPPIPPKSAPKPKAGAVPAMKAFDRKLDEVEPVRKGEPGHDTGVVNAKLDPEHELAPPPPAIVEPKKKKRRRKKKKADPVPPPLPPATTTVTPPLPKPARAEKVVKVAPPKKKLELPHVAEEAEVAKMMRKLEESGEKAPTGLEHDKIDEVRRKLSLTFPSSELDKRFRVLVGSRLSGVRTTSAFSSALKRPITQGGLGFDDHTVERVLDAVEGHLEETHTTAAKKHKDGKEAHVKARAEQYKTEKPSGSAPEKKTAAKKPEGKKAKATLSGASVKTTRTASGKKPIVDVQYKRRLVGPVEELRRMNLDDFRRLPGDPKEVLENIRGDMQSMTERDPALHIHSIEAWRSSPLVKLYRKLMSVALQRGLSMEDVLADKQVNPKEMTIEELNAIRTFNTSLRY